MLATLNPFNPGSGLRPPELVGRQAELDTLDTILARNAQGLASRGLVLSGLRGVGKTVLLNEMRGKAETAGWFVIGLEARGDAAGAVSARRTLARDIAAAARSLSRRRAITDRLRQALESVAAFNLKVGTGGIDLGVEVRPGRADSGDIEVDLGELVHDLTLALQEEGSALAVFVDELQDLDDELLRALLVTQHQAGQRGWPFYVFGAGLPHLPGLLAESRSYAERLFDYRTVSRLHDDEAVKAIVDPVRRQGFDINDNALPLLLEASGGYPYFLQEYGSATWDVAPGPVITRSDATAGIAVGLQRLDAGFFQSRWNRATPSERRMLVAMADDGDGPSSSGDVASRMTIKQNSLGPYRANLISKGLVWAPKHGQIAYTVPGMAAFVQRHRDDIAWS